MTDRSSDSMIDSEEPVCPKVRSADFLLLPFHISQTEALKN